jgi:caffeoyl-CoA O-methyltransferase
MSFILPEEIEKYLKEHSGPTSKLLEDLESETYEKTDNPQMLSGKVEGMFLKMLIQISGAKKIVEIGTFTGYSALMMAEGLPHDGNLITCEISEEFASIAERYFQRSPHGKKICIKPGPASQTLRQIPDKSVDFVFIDADKALYHLYYEESIRILKDEGLIVADNTLWSGRALSPKDSDSRAIASFNRKVQNDERVDKVMLSIRDGIYLIRKR